MGKKVVVRRSWGWRPTALRVIEIANDETNTADKEPQVGHTGPCPTGSANGWRCNEMALQHSKAKNTRRGTRAAAEGEKEQPRGTAAQLPMAAPLRLSECGCFSHCASSGGSATASRAASSAAAC